jgi:hypothetical protein
MQAAPALPVETAVEAAAAPVASGVPARAEPPGSTVSAPWLYRSEGFAEDLDADAGNASAPDDSPLLRWGLPTAALIGVVGLAAAFTLV